MKFWQFYRTICKRKNMIAALVIATCTIVFIATANQPRVYRATSQIMPSDAVLHRPILWSVNTDGAAGQQMPHRGNERAQLANLMSLITSRTVAERTAEMLNLDTHPDHLKNQISVDTAPSPLGESRAAPPTDIIRIMVTDGEPDRAVQVANAVAAVFANFYQEVSHQNAVSNTEFLDEEVAKAEASLDRTQEKLRQYKKSRGLSSMPEGMQATVEGLNAVMQQRDQAAAQLAESQNRLDSIRAQLRQESPNRVIEEGTTNSPAVQQLETQVANIKAQLIEAQSKYYDVHPTVQNLKESLKDAQGKLDAERNKIRIHHNMVANPVYQNLLSQRSQLESDVRGFSARLAKLDDAVGRAKGDLKPGEDVQLARLQQEFLDAQTLTSNVKQRLHQAVLEVKDTSQTGAIRLVDRALSAEGPIGRSRSSYMMMGFMLSLVIGVGLALTLESIDNRIRSNSDLEQLLSLPVNALIPSMAGRNAPALPKITYLDPLSPLAEAYRFLRTDLLLTAAELGVQTVMVATAKPGQGGTTTVANLAISLAMDGKRVVLVDADMRRPTQHRIFKTKNDAGLSNVLKGEKSIDQVVVTTEIPNLLVLPAGPAPTNPSELLGSQTMGEVVATLKSGADFVLFDTPSAIAFTDTVVLSRWIDGVLLVVRANQVPRGAELQVRKLFNKANVQILGVVLNDVQPNSVDSYYYHSHYYPSTGPTTLALEGGKGGAVEPEGEEPGKS